MSSLKRRRPAAAVALINSNRCSDGFSPMSLARDIRRILGKGGPVGVLLALGLVASSMRADAAELLSVRIGLARTAEAGPLYIAVANGYFRDEGLDAHLKFFDSDALVPAAAAGQVDIGVPR